MGTAREIIKKHKEESEFQPNWLDADEFKYYPEYSAELKKWQAHWTALWNFGADYFTDEEIEKVIRELNENCKEGWE